MKLVKLDIYDFSLSSIFNLSTKMKFQAEEFELSSLEDICDNRIDYLYKIYYLGIEFWRK